MMKSKKFHKEAEHLYYSVPKEIIERIHVVIQEEFEDSSEPPEIEFIGFDVKYQVNLRFKLR